MLKFFPQQTQPHVNSTEELQWSPEVNCLEVFHIENHITLVKFIAQNPFLIGLREALNR